MSDRNRNTMNDAELDALLTEELSALPPSDGLVTEITPWRRATNRILVGLALTCITLNFFWLDYLLPTIGVLLRCSWAFGSCGGKTAGLGCAGSSLCCG